MSNIARYPEAWPPSNFLGLPIESSAFETSAALLLPIPYEATTSYKGGTREGPRAIIEASQQVEFYDMDLGFDPSNSGIHTLPALSASIASQAEAMDDIANAVSDLIKTGKLLGILGGEHSISAGVVKGLAENFDSLLTVQLDAHADLRESYEGSKFSHACAARRIVEYTDLIQLGIRTLDISEAEFIAANPHKVVSISAADMRSSKAYLDTLAQKVSGRNVYLTFDVDVFDPSIMPSTGTPEPGGLDWYTVLEILRTIVSNSNVVAFDCVELSPIPGLHAPDFMVAKLVYKIIGHVLHERKQTLALAP